MENKIQQEFAIVRGRDLSISTKQAIEISNFIRGKSIKKSKILLQNVLDKKIAVPFRRFNMDVGHKSSIGPGRYPQKSTREIMKLLDSLEANAQNKGLDINKLYIKTIIPNKASRPFHFGRKRGIKMKRTHIDIIASEIEERENKEKKIIKNKKENPPKTIKKVESTKTTSEK